MIKFLFLFIISGIFVNAQQRAVSPFSLKDYKNMKDEYLKVTLEQKDHLLFLNNTYYSTEKLDSLLVIKDQLKRKYLQDNGKKNENITEKDLGLVKDEVLLPYAVFKIRRNGTEFYGINYDYAPQLFVETKGKSINFTFDKDRYEEGISDKISKLATGNYYYPNQQLKETRTIGSTGNTGLYQEYDSSGKLLHQIDWEKDFPVSNIQAKANAKKEILNFLTGEYTDQFHIADFKENEIKVHKYFYGEKKPVWLFRYYTIEGTLNSRTGKLMNITQEISIP